MEKPTPLINSAMLAEHAGQTVKVVGKLQRMTGQSFTLQTSDMGNVEVKLSQNSNVTKDSQYIEVVGKVDEQGESLREFTCVDLGHSLDMNLVEQCIQLQPRFPQLFSDGTN